jgi:Tetracyclin repressor-like, C-terminal domain
VQQHRPSRRGRITDALDVDVVVSVPPPRRLAAWQRGWEEAVRGLVGALVELHLSRPRLHALMHQYAPRVPDGVARLHALQDWLADEVADLLRRYGRGGADPERTAALLVQSADAQLHRVVLTGRGDADDLTRALIAMSG